MAYEKNNNKHRIEHSKDTYGVRAILPRPEGRGLTRIPIKGKFDKPLLPCPRCGTEPKRNEDIYSYPACGVLVTCKKCGGRSDWDNWQAGNIELTRNGKHFKYVDEKYGRPPNAD